MATRSANIIARVEPEVKAKSEAVLSNIGLSMSDAINLFCKQIIIQNGIPFSLKSEVPPSLDATSWNEEEIVSKVKKGMEDIKKGNARPVEEVFRELEDGLEYAI